jgi:hypothetical protein
VQAAAENQYSGIGIRCLMPRERCTVRIVLLKVKRQSLTRGPSAFHNHGPAASRGCLTVPDFQVVALSPSFLLCDVGHLTEGHTTPYQPTVATSQRCTGRPEPRWPPTAALGNLPALWLRVYSDIPLSPLPSGARRLAKKRLRIAKCNIIENMMPGKNLPG